MFDSRDKALIRAVTLALLIALGLAGNYFKLSLFFGFDFLFGSVFLMIILSLFGVTWGVFAAILASSITYLFWHHPYGIIVFSLEILFVGLLNRRYNKNLVLLDGLFWLCIASPLNWLFYFYFVKAGFSSIMLVILKQSVNGIFNVLIASIILDYVPIFKLNRASGIRKKIPIQKALFDLILSMILFPALTIMIINSRKNYNEIESTITYKLKNITVETTYLINSYIQRHMEGVNALANLAVKTQYVPSAALQEKVKIIKELYPDFHSMYVANAAGKTIAFYPEKNEKGESTIGLDYSDRPYYKELKNSLRPFMSDVFMGRGGFFTPIVTLSVPILEDDHFKGFALGSMDLNRFKAQLSGITDHWGVQATVFDQYGKVIASTDEALSPMQTIDWRHQGELLPLHSSVYKWLPPINTTKSESERWKKSFYILESPVGKNIPWKVLLAVPVAPYQKQLYETNYINSFSFMLALMVGSIIFSAFLSRRIVSPINKLMNATTDLPSKLTQQKTIDWPRSIFEEVHLLVENFEVMAISLTQKFDELRTAKEYVDNIIESMINTLIVVSVDDRIIRLNAATCSLLGYEEKELIDHPVEIIFAETSLCGEISLDKLKKRERLNNIEVFYLAKDKKEIPMLFSSAVLRGPNGDFQGIVCVAQDMTELKRTAEKLGIAYSELKATQATILQQEKMASIGQLAAGVAHEINNPISFVSSNLGTLDKYVSRLIEFIGLQAEKLAALGHGELSGELESKRKLLKLDHIMEDTRQIIRESLEGTDRVSKIVRNLKTFSHLDEAEYKLVDLNECLESAINIVWNEIRYKATLNKDLGPIPQIKCYPQQLNQVFLNLLINAAHAIEKQGEITVKTWSDASFINVSVADSGCGIPEEIQSRLFEPFFTTKEVGKGTGLGLSISYDIIKQHRGDLLVESVAGQGTTFTVRIPID